MTQRVARIPKKQRDDNVHAIQKGSIWHVVASSPQHGENTAFLSSFPIGGTHG